MEAGQRIGKYVLDERIAVGGMAEVWAARVEGLQGFVKPVALKFILESFAGDPDLERLFVNEARIAARLQHANLVAVFDFDKVDASQERGLGGRYYIAMERVEGHDLRRLSEAARAAGYVFPVGLALHVAGEVLKALRYVHERRDERGAMGLVHRDVSPHNVLVSYGGEVKLSDFGIAKAREQSARSTKSGGFRGKISYASPEQLASRAVDHRTDQFAAGVTIWELLAGRRLFDGASDMEILGQVARCEIPTFEEASGRRDVPHAVEVVLRRMLAPTPELRFPRTSEALSAVLALPGYSPDGAALGELMRTLFRANAAHLSQTVPIVATAAAAPAPSRDAETRTMHARAAGLAAPGGVAPSAPVDSVGPTVDVRSGGRVARLVGAAVMIVAAIVAAVVVHQRGAAVEPTPAPMAAPPIAAAPTPTIAPPPAPPSVVEPPPAPAPVIEEHDEHRAAHAKLEHGHKAEPAAVPAVAPPPAAVTPPGAKPPSAAGHAPIIE
ncbi:MAG TPA: serine/threonine-protein kinase [Polyangia bacterium]|nr:serine/threonine-protein kinase [Polyangia bacterium]